MRRLRNLSTAPVLAAALAVAGCGGIIPSGQSPSGGAVSRTSTAPAPSRVALPPIQRVASTQRQSLVHTSDNSCIAELNAAGASFDPLPDSYGEKGCSKLGTVRLTSLSGDGAQFGVSNVSALKCSTASTFNNWVRFGVDRAARQILGSGLERVETMGTYACRNVAGTERRSAHARAEAIDVSAFVLNDGRRIVLKSDWHGGSAAEREFLRVVHKSACKRFGTVLGPAYNSAHADHFHLEGTGAKFCR